MSEALKFLPPRVALMDPRSGLISREWYLFFQAVYDRIGGATGPSTTDLSTSLFEDAGSGETNALLFELEQSVSQTPAQYDQYVADALLAEVSALREQVAELSKEIEAIKQGVVI